MLLFGRRRSITVASLAGDAQQSAHGMMERSLAISVLLSVPVAMCVTWKKQVLAAPQTDGYLARDRQILHISAMCAPVNRVSSPRPVVRLPHVTGSARSPEHILFKIEKLAASLYRAQMRCA